MLETARLESTSGWQWALAVVERLVAAGYTALLAGGCVRDLLLGQVPKDYDVATNADPASVQQLFPRSVAIGASFGVVAVLGRDNQSIEVATFRTDGEYVDGRRPTGVRFATPDQDAQRRDFTINGLFFDPLSRAIIDHVGGQADLQAGLVRAIGDPHARFREDKLRLLRAIRFASRLDFRLEPMTLAAIRSMASQIEIVSAERIHAELKRMCVDKRRVTALTLLEETNLLSAVLPEFAVPLSQAGVMTMVCQLLEALGHEPSWPLVVATLAEALTDDDTAVAAVVTLFDRLKGSNEEREHAAWLVRHRSVFLESLTPSVAAVKLCLAQRYADDLWRLANVRAQSGRDASWAAGLAAVVELRQQWTAADVNPPPLVNGNDLKQLGLTPGPRFRELLDWVRQEQLENRLSDRLAALAAIRERLSDP